ncbi:MAG: hypothetical protein Aurels2KO_41710 [Aureliella sp.]
MAHGSVRSFAHSDASPKVKALLLSDGWFSISRQLVRDAHRDDGRRLQILPLADLAAQRNTEAADREPAEAVNPQNSIVCNSDRSLQ